MPRSTGARRLSCESLGRRGAEHRRFGRREEALAAFRQGLKRGPELPWVHALFGETLREMGGRRPGYEHIRRAVQLDPDCAYAPDFLANPGRFEAWVYGCRGGAARSRGDLDAAQRDLRRCLEMDPGCGWAWGWLGETLLRRERPEEAVAALTRAVGLFGEWPEAFAWRGEAKRAAGAYADALKDLDYAVALGYGQYDVHLNRASAHSSLGDEKGRLAALSQAVRSAPEVFRGQLAQLRGTDDGRWIRSALSAFGEADVLLRRAARRLEGGKAAEALIPLRAALAVDPLNAKTYFMLAEAKSALQKNEEALKDASEAVRLEPSSSSYAKRAQLAQKNGYMEAALKDMSVALALNPGADLFRWRARTFLGMRHYDLALRDISAAVELVPDDAEMHDLRAHVNLLLGRISAAQADVEQALRISPRNVHLHLHLAQVLAMRGRYDDARASVVPIEKEFPAWARFTIGYVDCIRKRYKTAASGFASAAAAAVESDGHLKLLAGYYGCVASAFGGLGEKNGAMSNEKTPATPDNGKVFLCGLGVYPPQTATVEVLHAISQCDVIFNNIPGPGISEFLGLFCSNRRPVAFRYEQDSKLCADLILSEVRPGRKVGFVTFGHPLLFGPVSHELIQRCRRRKIAVKAFGAVSSLDAVLAASGQVLGFSYWGFQLFETMGAVYDDIAVINSRLPAVIYFNEGMGDVGLQSLAKTLEKRYPPHHRCLLYGPRHERWEIEQETVTIKGLPRLAKHKLAMGILFIPPLGRSHSGLSPAARGGAPSGLTSR